MESDGETAGKPMTSVGGQICQICSDSVGKTVDGDRFVACDICGFPVCRPCYEYERKHGNQSCPQCKTTYKRHKGSPAIPGDKDEDVFADEATVELNYPQKEKISERMLGWHLTRGKSEKMGQPEYDKEVSHNHLPRLTSRQDTSGEFSAASPERLSVSSTIAGGKRLPYSCDINQSPNRRISDPVGLGNVAWKERVDGWKMKQEKNTGGPVSTQAASERGGGDIDASTDILADEALLNDEARQPLSS